MKPLGIKNYGSIPHLLGSKLGQTDKYVHEGQHRIMTEKTRDKHDYVIVTEKYDGSNVGIAKVNGKTIAITRSGYLAETSPYTQHHYFANWVEMQGNRFDFIGENERIAGEWMMCAHGIKYEVLGDPFIAFDYFNANNERLTYDLFSDTLKNYIAIPNIIHCGYSAFPIDKAMNILNEKKCEIVTAIDKPEGLVYRVERKGKFDYSAKFVRQDHECGIYIIDVAEENLTWNINPETYKIFEVK